ncbi:MAG: hypothetical protein H6Q12_216 [Bacteroidetes bacterium]|nr:hypothetical protein [Bacteroidota bacterium]
MKKLYFILLSSLLCGCSGDNLPGGNMEDTPLSVSSVSLSGVETKAITALTSGSIGVFRTTAGGYTALKNVQYTYSSGWSAASPIYLTSNAVSVCAYSPYGAAGITSSTDPTAVTLTSQVYSAAQDLSYSTLVSTPTSASPNVTFTMNHAYAKIYFTITRDASYPNTCAITNISIANTGIKTAGTLNMTTGAYGTGTAGTVSYNPGIASIASGGNATSQVLMVPVTTAMTGNVNISFTIDGSVYTTSFSALTTLVAGNNYKINITVQAASLSVTGVDIAAWTNYNATDTSLI